jgi:hypothetical protein
MTAAAERHAVANLVRRAVRRFDGDAAADPERTVADDGDGGSYGGSTGSASSAGA